MDFIIDNHLQGLVIGICTFLIIGMFHPIVVKAEYYWSTRCWWLFLFLGIAGVISSLCIENVVISSLLGVFAFSSFWSIKEIFEQEKRVQKGWFPKNPQADLQILKSIPIIFNALSYTILQKRAIFARDINRCHTGIIE